MTPPVMSDCYDHCHRWLSRNALLMIAIVLAGSGCTSVSRSTTEAIGLLFKGRPAPPTAAQVAAVRYPQILVHAPELNGVLVLGHIDEGRQIWYAGKDAVYYLRDDGLLLGSAGLGRISTLRLAATEPFPRLTSVQHPVRVQRHYDWMPGYRYNVPVSGVLRRIGPESVDILGHARALVRYEEVLQGPGFTATNLYWADTDTGFIWKSRQYLAPDRPIDIVQLKPYRPTRS